MVSFLPSPKIEANNRLLDLAPLAEAFAANRSASDRSHLAKVQQDQQTIDNAFKADQGRRSDVQLRQQQANADRSHTLQRRQVSQGDERLNIAREAQGQDILAKRKMQLAGVAQLVEREKDPERRSAMWQALVNSDPKLQGLPPEFNNPDTGPRFLVAEAMGPTKQASAQGGFKDQKQVLDVERDYRKEFNSLTKDFRDISDAYAKVQSSSANPSAAGDLALVFNFMKMLDPGSVVREGEFATAQDAAGVPQRVLNIYNRLISGERLAPEQRSDFESQAGNVWQSQRVGYDRMLKQYRTIAEGGGIDPQRAIPDLAPANERPPQGRAISASPKPAAEMTDDELAKELGL